MSQPGPFTDWQSRLVPRETAPPHSGDQPDNLPPRFQFSQNSLQDYVDCARRFQLRYALGQRWPAAEAEPIEEYERLARQGTEFHRLVQRHQMGIPEAALRPVEQPLADWWDAYLTFPPEDLPGGLRLPETQLSTALGDHRLLARFDLLAIDPGERIVIVDWKTGLRRPPRDVLARRLQTRVYPLVAIEAGAHLFGGEIAPEQVALMYWYAADPARPEVFSYSADRYAADRAYLSGLIEEITTRREAIWPLTPDERHCRYCVYRSLCDRGIAAAPLDAMESAEADVLDDEVDFDFEFELSDIDEIAF